MRSQDAKDDGVDCKVKCVAEKHILLIEDDADVRAWLAEVLADAGLCVDLAADGVSGLERLRDGPLPSVIVLDLRMPRLGGIDFLRALRDDARFDHVPVITMSAGHESPSPHDALAHLHKPFDVEDLLGIVLSLTEATAA
jgi:two-component system, chemotaxis family, chemotaxis protein CheY